MSRDKRIRYGIDEETGIIVSQNLQTGEICWPTIDFSAMIPDDGFAFKWSMGEPLKPLDLAGFEVHWTRKIPTKYKNIHREYWGMKPLPIPRKEA